MSVLAAVVGGVLGVAAGLVVAAAGPALASRLRVGVHLVEAVVVAEYCG